MIVTLHTIKWPARHNLGIILLLCLLLTGAWLLQSYVNPKTVNFLLGFIVLPFLIQPAKRHTEFGWMLVIMLLFITVIFFLPAATFLYMAGSLVLLYVIHIYWRSRIFYTAFVLLLMSPVASYMSSVFTFPIRIFLTQLVGDMLKWVGGEITVSGNTLHWNNMDYTVDAACMGLRMLEVSLIAGVFVIVQFEKKWNKRLSAPFVLFYLLQLFFLNIVCNLFRILILVLTGWMPGTLLHEVAGIVCFISYIIIPAIYLARWLINYRGKQFSDCAKEGMYKPFRMFLQTLSLLLLFVVGGLQIRYGTVIKPSSSHLPVVKGYQLTESAPGIWKYFNDSTLVYVKAVRGFYDTDHQPMLCWKGSGYTFSHVQMANVGTNQVYTAELEKENNHLFSAWWYSNGGHSTLSQWTWRSEMLKGSAPYYLMNITSYSSESLKKAIEEWHRIDWIPLKESNEAARTAVRDESFRNISSTENTPPAPNLPFLLLPDTADSKSVNE